MNQESMPLVTAVIPVYNHEKYVVESIRSILNQTYRNIELIVINDGSKDRSHEMVLTLVEECKQRFVRFEYLNRENHGLSATLNQALGMARGTYLTALASDDVALPEKIEILVNALQAKDESYAAACGDAFFIDEEGHKLFQDEDGSLHANLQGKLPVKFLEFYTNNREFDYRGDAFGSYKSLIIGNYLPAMSNIVKIEAILEAGGWTRGNVIEDWEMWLKLSKGYKFLLVDRPVALYRWHESNSVKTSIGKLRWGVATLLSREKIFCFQNGLKKIWLDKYGDTLSLIMNDRTIPISSKISVMSSANTRTIFPWAIKRIVRKACKFLGMEVRRRESTIVGK